MAKKRKVKTAKRATRKKIVAVLSGDPDRDLIRYSDTERALFNLLPMDGSKIDTKELTELYYNDTQRKKVPLHGRVIVNGTVQQLIEKVKRNNEPFIIHHSGRAGPNSAVVWIKHRKRKTSTRSRRSRQAESYMMA